MYLWSQHTVSGHYRPTELISFLAELISFWNYNPFDSDRIVTCDTISYSVKRMIDVDFLICYI